MTALDTDAEIERIAREQFDLVRPGEQAFAILPAPAAHRPAAGVPVRPHPQAAWGVRRPVDQPVWSPAYEHPRARGCCARKTRSSSRPVACTSPTSATRCSKARAGSPSCARPSRTPASLSIDTDDAKQAPGVVGVFTAADLGLTPAPYGLPLLNQAMLRTLARHRQGALRRRADRRDRDRASVQGEDAAERVLVDYEALPAVIDVFEARDGSTLLFEDAARTSSSTGRSWASSLPTTTSSTAARSSSRSASSTSASRRARSRCGGAPPRGSTAGSCSGRARSTRTARATRSQAANGLEAGQVRVIAPDVGGGFGAKIGAYPEELLLGALAKEVGPPGALARDPHREHGGARPRPRPGPGR